MSIKLYFKFNEKVVEAKAEIGETLLQVAQNNGIPLIGGCGGAGVCGSCKVEFDEQDIQKLPEADMQELDLLECLPGYSLNMRLACQVVVNENMDGLTVYVD